MKKGILVFICFVVLLTISACGPNNETSDAIPLSVSLSDLPSELSDDSTVEVKVQNTADRTLSDVKVGIYVQSELFPKSGSYSLGSHGEKIVSFSDDQDRFVEFACNRMSPESDSIVVEGWVTNDDTWVEDVVETKQKVKIDCGVEDEPKKTRDFLIEITSNDTCTVESVHDTCVFDARVNEDKVVPPITSPSPVDWQVFRDGEKVFSGYWNPSRFFEPQNKSGSYRVVASATFVENGSRFVQNDSQIVDVTRGYEKVTRSYQDR